MLWTKYLFRFLHIGPVVVLGGKIINDYLLGSKADLTKGDKSFYAICGVILMIAGTWVNYVGFVNTFLLKPKDNMKDQAKFWIAFHHTKLLLSCIILTPIIGMMASPDGVNTIRFYFVVFNLIVSPFMRFYREFWTQKHQKAAK